MAGNQSLGFVEVMGLVAAIECADAMAKAARVSVKTVANADAGLLSVVCEGDLAACGAAVDAGKAAVQRMGSLISTNLIPRPDGDTEALLGDFIPPLYSAEKAPAAAAAAKPKAKAKPAAKKK